MALIDDLEKEGYDTSQITPDLVASLEKEGYDTSGLKKGPPAESPLKSFVRKAANYLPTVGAIGVPAAAGIATEGLSLPATSGLAAAGGAGGEAAKQLILRALNAKNTSDFFTNPTLGPSAGDAAKDIGIEGAKDAALTYAGGKLLPPVGEALGKAGGFAKKLIFAPGASEVGQAGKEAIADIAAKGAEKLGLAQETAAAGKAGLISAEEKAGLHFGSTPEFEGLVKNPDEMAKFVESKSNLLKGRTPQQLAQEVDPQSLQTLRKVAQEGEKMTDLSDIAKSQLKQIKTTTTAALGEAEPEVGDALKTYHTANDVAAGVPAEIKARIAAQKLTNSQNVIDAQKLENTRKLIKAGLATAGAYLGVKKLTGGH